MSTTVLSVGRGEADELALGFAFCALLVTVTTTDLDRRTIPNVVLLAGAVVAVTLVAATDPSSLGTRAIAAAAAGSCLLVVALVHPPGMGMGDVKLAAVMGLYLGGAVAPALLVGFGAGAFVGLAAIARHGVAARKRTVPFGPFLALGGAVALWYGDDAVNWYLDSFL